ncbi:MAG: hypothetical protein LAO77_00635 [Acidobacteriia bacterium]|nr:hypothetical protein [Terriglobia bacterium]
MICGWLGPLGARDGGRVAASMARAARVHAGQRVVIREAPGGLAVAVIDLDDPAAGDFGEPAVSANQRYWLWMSGEAYDGGALCDVRSAQQSRTLAFRQTLLDALLARGVDAIAGLDGRYHIALFDAVDRVATVMNDRFGGLPLFWAHSREGTAFAGGVRGVLMAPGVDAAPDADAIREAVTFGGFRLGERTNVRGVTRVRGGTVLTIDTRVSCRSYWTWPHEAPAADRPVTALIEEAAGLWRRAIGVRVADARRPGQTLSGGLDSRAILAEGAQRAPAWTALTYGVPDCDDARYAKRAAAAAGAKWIFYPLYSGHAPDWLARRTAYIQETDGLIQLVDLMHYEALHLQPELMDVNVSGYIGDVVCGTTYDSIVDAASLLAKLPFSGVEIGWTWDRAIEWAAATIGALAPSDAKYSIYEHKFPQAIHLIFQSYAPYVRVRAPFTDYALFDFFAARSRQARATLYTTWLARKYPAFFRRIPDQRTGMPITAPQWLIALERLRRGGMREIRRVARALSVPIPPRIRAYQDEDRQWAVPAMRRQIEAVILRPESLAAGIFGRDRVARTVADLFDRGIGPVQAIGALYTYEAYHRDLPAYLRSRKADVTSALEMSQ